MKILLITGLSGTGKSTIAKKLCENDGYNLICSYTDRLKRDKDDTDHTFVSSNYMDLILDCEDVVAQTKINEHRYCAIASQFVEDKVNVYITDVDGMNDIIESFAFDDIMSILIRRENIEVESIREKRDVCVPTRDDVDFLIYNDSKVESAVGTIKALVGFDLFSKPSHKVKTIQEKIDYVDRQYRYLGQIRKSLYEQLWYLYQKDYLRLCIYVEEQINKDFEDYSLTIRPDTEPEIYNDDLVFNIIINYTDNLSWTDTNRIVEKASHYAHAYCETNNIKGLSYYLLITDMLDDNYE